MQPGVLGSHVRQMVCEGLLPCGRQWHHSADTERVLMFCGKRDYRIFDIFNGVILQGNRLVIAKPMTAGCVTVEETTRKSAWQN
jgi:hypothetical protein